MRRALLLGLAACTLLSQALRPRPETVPVPPVTSAAPRRRRGRLVLLAVVVAAATLGVVAAGAPTATVAPNRDTCDGYPEPRAYVEQQTWWTPMPGHTMDEPFQDRTGHIHIGGCIPLYQPVTGTLHLDLKWQLHALQGTNVTDLILELQGNDGAKFSTILKEGAGGFSAQRCQTMQCEGWISYDLPTSQVSASGLLGLSLSVRGFLSDGRLTRTIGSWPIRIVNGKPDASLTDVVQGGGWFEAPPSGPSLKYSVVGVSRAELAKVWTPVTGLVPRAGSFTFTASFPGPGARVMVDPAFHAMPPSTGMVLLDVDPAANTASDGNAAQATHTVTVDTTKLTNGRHRLVLQTRRNRVDGEHSGLFVLPFLVVNPTLPPPPPPPSGYHPACEPTCDQKIADLQAAMDAHMAELDRLGNENAQLKDRIGRAVSVLQGP